MQLGRSLTARSSGGSPSLGLVGPRQPLARHTASFTSSSSRRRCAIASSDAIR